MTTLLLCWYALGWAGVAIWTRLDYSSNLTLCAFLFMLLGGGMTFFCNTGCWLIDAVGWLIDRCPIIWRREK